MEDLPLVSIIITHYNRESYLPLLLQSIINSDYPKNRVEIIVIDLGSKDIEKVSKIIENHKQKYSDIAIYLYKFDHAYPSQGRNLGIDKASGKYMFFVDDDNFIHRNTVRELVSFMESNHRVGMSGPIIYNYREHNQIDYSYMSMDYWTTITRSIKKIFFNGRIPYETYCIPNSYMIRKEVLSKIGKFDDKFFPIHYEEGDLCERIRAIGYYICIIPKAIIYHDSKKDPLRNNYRRYYFTIRNRYIYHRKYSKNKFQKLISVYIFSLLINLYYTLKVILKNKGNIKYIKLFILATKHGFYIKL